MYIYAQAVHAHWQYVPSCCPLLSPSCTNTDTAAYTDTTLTNATLPVGAQMGAVWQW